jgi:hypothetical protein
MNQQPAYPPPPGWGPPPKRGTPVWVWFLVGCGGLFVLGSIAIGYFVVRVSRTVTSAIGQMAAESEAATKNLKVIDHKLTTYQGKRFIVGSVKNVSPTDTYESVSVSFTLFDKAGEEMEDGLDAEAESPLKPGAVWRFKAEVEDPAVKTYKVSDVSGMRPGATERIFGVKPDQTEPGNQRASGGD